MEQTKNLCAQIPISLHTKVREEQEQAGQTVSQYITELLLNYYESKEKGGRMMESSRTLAFQIPEEMFQRIKAHLAAETARTGQKLTQRDFVLGLIERALEEAEVQAATVELPEYETQDA